MWYYAYCLCRPCCPRPNTPPPPPPPAAPPSTPIIVPIACGYPDLPTLNPSVHKSLDAPTPLEKEGGTYEA